VGINLLMSYKQNLRTDQTTRDCSNDTETCAKTEMPVGHGNETKSLLGIN